MYGQLYPNYKQTSKRDVEEHLVHSPMSTGSPSHISEPIQINIPRRRLFGTGDASQDSGFESPTHHYFLRRPSAFPESIYEEDSEFESNQMNDTVFTFEEDQPNQILRPSPPKHPMLRNGSSLNHVSSTMETSPMNQSSPLNNRVMNIQSPIRDNTGRRENLELNFVPPTLERSTLNRLSDQRLSWNHSSPVRSVGTLSPVKDRAMSVPSTARVVTRNALSLNHSFPPSNSLPTNEHHNFSSPVRTSPLVAYSSQQFFRPVNFHEICGRRRSRSDPSAPPLHLYEDIEGYELTTAFSSVFMLAPPYYHGNEPPPPYEDSHQHLKSTLNEEDAIEAFTSFVANKCWNANTTKKVISKVKTKEIFPGSEHQYVLETFYEERKSIWYQEPYTSQLIDGPENGPPPQAWDIEVSSPVMFQEKEVYKEVPHTATVKDCSCCHGKGSKHCSSCQGMGNVKCSVCDGIGILYHFSHDGLTYDRSSASVVNRSCQNCNSGRRGCNQCQSSGRKACNTCQGQGQLKIYIRLTVKWKLLKSDEVLECSRLPKKYIAEVSGSTVFQEENDRVYPLIDFPENELNDMSRHLINNHKEQLKHARVIMQRHLVREVPVSEVRSEYKQKIFTYWVYGNENRVYCPDNPVKFYSSCSIL